MTLLMPLHRTHISLTHAPVLLTLMLQMVGQDADLRKAASQAAAAHELSLYKQVGHWGAWRGLEMDCEA